MKKEAFILLTVILALFFFANIVSAPPLPGIWLSQAEIQALPIAGQAGCDSRCTTAWNTLKAKADSSCGTPALSNQDDPTNVCIMAKAIVFVRLGQESYRTDVKTALRSIVNSGTYSGRALALGRELGAYVVSADLIDLKNHDPTLDNQFRIKIRELLTTPTSSGPSSLVDCHENRPNNWGTHCGFSRAAVASYLGDTTELARTAQVFIGWLGDRASYAGFTYGDLSWQCNPAAPVGINPLGCTKDGHNIDGVLPDDQRRGGSFSWPPPKVNYVYEGLQGALAQAVVLQRAGYDVWNARDKALLRSFIWLHNVDNFTATGDDEWESHLVNYIYRTNFSEAVPAGTGKNVGWTDWTHAQIVAEASPTCTDTDSNVYPTKNYNVNGTATSGLSSFIDTCETSTSLREYFCQLSNSNSISNEIVACQNGCSSGKCNLDTIAPEISNVQSSAEATYAVIQWTTNEFSTSVVRYGTSQGSLTSTATGDGAVSPHNVQINNLQKSTTYYYIVESTDNAGNKAQLTSPLNFTTKASSPGGGGGKKKVFSPQTLSNYIALLIIIILLALLIKFLIKKKKKVKNKIKKK